MLEDHEQQTRVIATLVELEFINQNMDLQEERDRNQVSLFGLNETQFTVADFMQDQLQHKSLSDSAKKAQGVGNQIAIQLNDDCLQCCSYERNQDPTHIKMLQTAFKMACVNYKSSDVIYRGNSFSRESLI